MKTFILAIILGWANLLYAQTVTFVLGEWEPFTGETIDGYGKTAQVVTKACEKAGLTCEYEFMGWPRANSMALQGHAIGTFPWFANKKRKEQFIFSKESVSAGENVFFYTKNVAFPKNWENNFSVLNGLPIVSVGVYTVSEDLKKAGVDFHKVSASKKAWDMIRAGRKKVFPDDIQVGRSECKKYVPKICDTLKVSKPINKSPMYIMFSRVADNSKVIQEKLDKALAEMKKNGEYDAIMYAK
jgi:polar amino acid transport system substrate-binding protein